jgi:hypothetical protein
MSYHEMVEDLAKGRFGASKVVRVSVHDDLDWDGVRFIDVTVVWDDSDSKFDVAKAADFKRDLRAALGKEDGQPFPVVNFKAMSEESSAA